jgi:hypothetical protein
LDAGVDVRKLVVVPLLSEFGRFGRGDAKPEPVVRIEQTAGRCVSWAPSGKRPHGSPHEDNAWNDQDREAAHDGVLDVGAALAAILRLGMKIKGDRGQGRSHGLFRRS